MRVWRNRKLKQESFHFLKVSYRSHGNLKALTNASLSDVGDVGKFERGKNCDKISKPCKELKICKVSTSHALNSQKEFLSRTLPPSFIDNVGNEDKKKRIHSKSPSYKRLFSLLHAKHEPIVQNNFPRKIQIPYTFPYSELTSHPHNFLTPIGNAHYQIYRSSLPLDLLPLLGLILKTCTKNIKSWETNLYSLTKQDVALIDVPGAYQLARPIVEYVKHVLSMVYTEKGRMWPKDDFCGGRKRGNIVMDRNQPHLLKYSTEHGQQTGVQLHHDNCDYTVNLMMSNIDEYEGGGTYFADVKETVKLNFGEFLLHPGVRVHSGHAITKGSRFLMVMFSHLEHYQS